MRSGLTGKKRLALTLLFVLVVAPFLSVLVLQAPSIPKAYAVIGPNTAVALGAAETTNPLTGYSYQNDVNQANGRYWVFYFDNSNHGWVSSTDGITWSSETTFATSTAANQKSMALAYSGTSAYYVGESGSQSTTSFYFRYGTLNSDGSITWTIAEKTVTGTSHGTALTPSLVFDTSGNLWASLGTCDVGCGTDYTEIWECASPIASCTWTQSTVITHSSGNGNQFCGIKALSSGKLASVCLKNTQNVLEVETYSGSAWNSAIDTTGTSYSSGGGPEAIATIGDTLEVVAADTSFNVNYLTYAYGAAGWGSPKIIDTGSSYNPKESIATDGSSTVTIIYNVDSSANVYKIQSSNSGSSFGSKSLLETETSVDAGIVMNTVGANTLVTWTNAASNAQVKFYSTAASATVTVNLTCTMSPSSATQATLTLTASDGSTPSPNNPKCDNAAHAITVNPSVTLTATEPAATSTSQDVFSGGATTATFSTPASASASWSLTNYLQYKVTIAEPGGGTQYSFTYTSTGTAKSASTANQFVDAGSSITATDTQGYACTYSAINNATFLSTFRPSGIQIATNASISTTADDTVGPGPRITISPTTTATTHVIMCNTGPALNLATVFSNGSPATFTSKGVLSYFKGNTLIEADFTYQNGQTTNAGGGGCAGACQTTVTATTTNTVTSTAAGTTSYSTTTVTSTGTTTLTTTATSTAMTTATTIVTSTSNGQTWTTTITSIGTTTFTTVGTILSTTMQTATTTYAFVKMVVGGITSTTTIAGTTTTTVIGGSTSTATTIFVGGQTYVVVTTVIGGTTTSYLGSDGKSTTFVAGGYTATTTAPVESVSSAPDYFTLGVVAIVVIIGLGVAVGQRGKKNPFSDPGGSRPDYHRAKDEKPDYKRP